MTGCTAFLVNLTTTPDHKLVKADAAKLAAKYGLTKYPWGVEWCAMSLAHWRGRS